MLFRSDTREGGRPVATLRPQWTGSRRVGDPQDSEGVRLPRHEFINRCPDDVLVHGRQAEPPRGTVQALQVAGQRERHTGLGLERFENAVTHGETVIDDRYPGL